ncbi:hypothetical protein FA95DRAFT_1252805 [Auriscalpium vulgare]|uniref:Uncharacterized protein n=1 Tax=Auriscalpium vulgare TaxID=40419 RepID=A0ACB8S9V6_9AGAM|nr:hypothetical protein FA95DRAFT_1252805 [Auriscalpium vulgare]
MFPPRATTTASLPLCALSYFSTPWAPDDLSRNIASVPFTALPRCITCTCQPLHNPALASLYILVRRRQYAGSNNERRQQTRTLSIRGRCSRMQGVPGLLPFTRPRTRPLPHLLVSALVRLFRPPPCDRARSATQMATRRMSYDAATAPVFGAAHAGCALGTALIAKGTYTRAEQPRREASPEAPIARKFKL